MFNYKYYPGKKKGRAYFQTWEAADAFACETSLYYLVRVGTVPAWPVPGAPDRGWVATWYNPDEAPAS
jgi:hypothetical protein